MAICSKGVKDFQALVSSTSVLFGGGTSSASSCLSIRSSSLCKLEISNSWFKIWSISLHMSLLSWDLGFWRCVSASWGIIHLSPDILCFQTQRISSKYESTQIKWAQYDQKKKLGIDAHLLSPLWECGGLERTDFNSFYFGRVWWSWKNSFLTVSTLEGCGGLERTHF